VTLKDNCAVISLHFTEGNIGVQLCVRFIDEHIVGQLHFRVSLKEQKLCSLSPPVIEGSVGVHLYVCMSL
jgi:hypothetical protein